jgi:hypothetical protein
VVPLFVHELAQECRDVLVTDKFLYVTDKDGKNLSIVSWQHPENIIYWDFVSNLHFIFTYILVH